MKPPTNQRAHPARKAADWEEPSASVRHAVLHIDDDANDSELIRAALLQAQVPFDLRNIESGEQAIAYLSGTGQFSDRSQHPLPSLILLDLRMPRANGLDVLKWIRANAASAQTPVVVLSGSELKDHIEQAYANGADAYVVKPIGFAALVELVKELYEKHLKGGAMSGGEARVAGLVAVGSRPAGTGADARI